MPLVCNNPKFFVVGTVACCALLASIGCQRRAYTDIYAENMASEIRELENRIYEYDAEYQGIENELAVLQSENSRLHDQLRSLQTQSSRPNTDDRSLFNGFQNAPKSPRTPSTQSQRPINPGSMDSPIQIVPSPDSLPNNVPKNVPKNPPKAPAINKTPSVDNLPAPQSNPPEKTGLDKRKTDVKELEPPVIEFGKPGNSILPPSNSAIPNRPSIPNPSSIPNPPASSNLNNDSLLPPPSNNGIVAPPNSGAAKQSKATLVSQTAAYALPSSLDNENIDDNRIELPFAVQPAGFQTPSNESSSQSVQDTKVIEIAFHPTLCRGQNTDAKNAEDGLYLVLQPRNASGETIDIPAGVTIVALDPNRPEAESKIGRWSYSMEEVEASLEPIGVSHGFHILLPWQAIKPLDDSVLIYIRYEMADGRRLVNERRIQLHVPSAGSATWTPRVAK
ncbi:MAG: hypothetical protein SGI77_23385 [Pirellulaceae bacterium]|nr:hypothetical protein [Pirellulaceae bacterium]